MISFQQKNVKTFRKHCPAAIGTAFTAKLVLDAEVQNSDFSYTSDLGLS